MVSEVQEPTWAMAGLSLCPLAPFNLKSGRNGEAISNSTNSLPDFQKNQPNGK